MNPLLWQFVHGKPAPRIEWFRSEPPPEPEAPPEPGQTVVACAGSRAGGKMAALLAALPPGALIIRKKRP